MRTQNLTPVDSTWPRGCRGHVAVAGEDPAPLPCPFLTWIKKDQCGRTRTDPPCFSQPHLISKELEGCLLPSE